MAQKKSKERPEEPLGTMSYQTSSKQSPPFWLLIGARKMGFLAPIRSQNGSPRMMKAMFEAKSLHCQNSHVGHLNLIHGLA